jgi:hypothetical protein
MEEIGTKTGVTEIRGTPAAAMSESDETQVGEMGTKTAIGMTGTRRRARKEVGMQSASRSRRRMASGMRGRTLSLERRENPHNHKVCVCVPIPLAYRPSMPFVEMFHSNTRFSESNSTAD